MYLPIDTSKAREREAQNARNNRLAIVKALADGEISRRDLFKWGLLHRLDRNLARNADSYGGF